MKPWQSFWNRNRRVAVLYGVGSLFFLLSALFACCAGSSGLSLSELLQGLSYGVIIWLLSDAVLYLQNLLKIKKQELKNK